MKIYDPHQSSRIGTLKASECFEHSALILGKHYPDNLLVLARRGFDQAWLERGIPYQVNLYSPNIDWLEPKLLWDPQLNWHQQQWGRAGLIAAGSAVIDDHRQAFVTLLQSDLLQQLDKFPAYKARYKTRLKNRFGRWYVLLCNAILDQAITLKLTRVYFPTAETILRHIGKPVTGAIYQRIYDSVPRHFHCQQIDVHDHSYWCVSPSASRERIARLHPQPAQATPPRKTVCILHDIAQDIDAGIGTAARAGTGPATSAGNLRRSLDIEAVHRVSTGYTIRGRIFDQSIAAIERSGGHAVGFHAYNDDESDLRQLPQVREVNLQVKGYHPLNSTVTAELTDLRLGHYNFEWLASSSASLGFDDCRVERGIAKIPLITGDWPLQPGQSGQADYSLWRRRLLRAIEQRGFIAFGLHHRHARHWLHDYDRLLTDIEALGVVFTTPAEVATQLYIEAGQSLETRLA